MVHHESLSPFVPIAAFTVGTIVGVVISRYRTHLFQNRGEVKVTRALRKFAGPNYHLLNHITLPLQKGSTQVDHILISRFGVFVIETKDHGGWIFAGAEDRHWTQVIYGNKFRFRNPLSQNQGHVRAIQKLLEFLPPDAFRPVV